MPVKNPKVLDELSQPFLEEVTTESWNRFTNEFQHYLSLGGEQKWPALCSVSALRFISTISGVTEFSLESQRDHAFMKTEGLFAATTTIEVYDKLRLLKMRRHLTLDNYLKHVQKFIDTEARSHAKTDPKKVIDIFV
ncbi:hypothetical protein ADUPG1_004498, partial [Aduncisulcus paluster]